MKRCNRCKVEKEESEFYTNRTKKDGLHCWCKICLTEYNGQRKEHKHKYDIVYKAHNKELIKKQNEVYRKAHKQQHSEYMVRNYTLNSSFRLQCVLRGRLRKALKNGSKHSSAVRDAGCSWDELRAWIEAQFTDGMCWENAGEWEIDHVIPFKFLTLKDANGEDYLPYEHQRVVCHYTNLRPMWAKDNMARTYDDIPNTPAINLVWYL